MKMIGLVLSSLAVSFTAHAGTPGDAQGQFLAAQNESVQQAAKTVINTNTPEISDEQCDLNPADATFPQTINAKGDLTVRFSCVTSVGYTAYIDVAGTLSSDGSSVKIRSAELIHTNIKP